ncbi:MAG TPA: aldehyde dehydrogenase family protein, partial [Phycisphaerae bacterium]
ANSTGTFHPENPATGEPLPYDFPISAWSDVDAALAAATAALPALRDAGSAGIAKFLNRFAERIEARAAELSDTASKESGLARSPRLADVELPRTTGQLRQAAAAALDGSWSLPTIDTKANIRSCLSAVGPVAVFGPNNFPFAFNSAAGGDFAAAIAAGCPVIAKANTSHPRTTQLLSEEALAALTDTGLPAATVQLIYRTSHEDGSKFVADPRLGASAYTGSRSAGLKLKSAADAAGKPIYLELSSVNPVLMLPGALTERLQKCIDEFVDSSLLGAGQFCTNPSIVMLLAGGGGAGDLTEQFIAGVKAKFEARPVQPLLSSNVCKALGVSVGILQKSGAKLLTGGTAQGPGYRFAHTLLRVDGDTFLAHAEALQTEAFGNAALMVVCKDAGQLASVLGHLEGNLTGCAYSDTTGTDDKLYDQLVPLLRPKVGRLLNDKMPTGVAVSPAMNHGGPYPSTGHAGFTAVGIPASLRRFGNLYCFDNIRPHRLPALLANKNPTGKTWRLIDGTWTQADI